MIFENVWIHLYIYYLSIIEGNNSTKLFSFTIKLRVQESKFTYSWEIIHTKMIDFLTRSRPRVNYSRHGVLFI